MPTKITTLVIEQFKRIKAITITPAENGVTSIGGKNRSGKTSILDGIAYALGGAAMCPSEAKNRDEKKAPYLRVELSNGMIVERKGKNGSLTVMDPEGGSGQGILDKLIDKLALNLPKFLNATSKIKAKTLLKIIGVGDQLQDLDDNEKKLYDDRRLVGRDVDRLGIELKAMPWNEDVGELISTSEIIGKIDSAQKVKASVDEIRAGAAHALERATIDAERSDRIRDELKTLRANISAQKDRAADLMKEANDTVIPDTAELVETLEGAEGHNAKVNQNRSYVAKRNDLKLKQSEHAKLEGAIEGVREQRDELLDSVEMPLAGLSVSEGELIYNGDHWDCMSGADQLKVAASIVREVNPECGFVLIDKTEQLDVETLEEFGQWAESIGLQILSTRVGTGDENTLIIEDGEIVDE